MISSLSTQTNSNYSSFKVNTPIKEQSPKEKFKNKDISEVKVENSKDIQIKKEIEDMKSYEKEVINHEKTHMIVGGGVSGAPSYIYKKGPDGKKYVVGGEVNIFIPSTNDPEKTKQLIEKVKRAATSPSNPSPQDLKTAAMAASLESSINNKIIKKKATEAYSNSKKIELQFKEINNEYINPLEKLEFKEARVLN